MLILPLVREGHSGLVENMVAALLSSEDTDSILLKLKSRYSHSHRSDHVITFPSAQNRAFVMTETESFLRLRKSTQNSTQ